MVMNTSKTSGSPRTRKQAEQEKPKAGKKRAMQDSDSAENEEEDEVTLETLKKLSKKMKPSAKEADSEEDDDDEGSDEDDDDVEGDSEDDEEGDDDEEDDDDDDEQDDEESDEEEVKPVSNKAKSQPVQPKKTLEMNGKAPEKATQVTVDGNAVAIFNLDNHVRRDNLREFIESKTGVSCNSCYVSSKTSALITTKNKQDAEKIMKACQSVLYQGSQMQICTIASGLVSQPRDLHDVEPSKTILVYSLTTIPPLESVKKLVPNAIECHKSHSGIYMSFNNVDEAKDAFIKLINVGTFDGVKCMIKYVKNTHVSSVFTGNETRVVLFNVPYGSTKEQVQELAPKATFVHFNPVAMGSWIVEFASPKDCKDAGERLTNYNMSGRTIHVSFAAPEGWDIKFIAKSKVNDAQMLFHKQFPDMIDFHIMTAVFKKQRTPAFMLTFKNREAWQRALEKALNFHSIGGVRIYVVNQGKLRDEFVKKGGKQPLAARKVVAKPEPMDDDEDESADDDVDDDEDVPASNAPAPRRDGGAKFGGQQRGGRGGNFRGRGRPQRGRGGNFRGRGK